MDKKELDKYIMGLNNRLYVNECRKKIKASGSFGGGGELIRRENFRLWLVIRPVLLFIEVCIVVVSCGFLLTTDTFLLPSTKSYTSVTEISSPYDDENLLSDIFLLVLVITGAGGVSPRGGVSRKRGVPTGSAPSRSDGIGTVGTDEAAGAGVAAVGGPGRGRETRGGVLARLADGRGVPPGPRP